MMRVLHFINKTELRKYHIQGIDFELEVNSQIFPPSPHGSFFAENIKINKGDKVIDVGSGSGILGILSAKLGGAVCATDSDKDAVEITLKNAQKNKVEINAKIGEYFEPFEGEKFDVIIANLPQEIVHESYQKSIGDKLNKTISGGRDGNEQLLKMLDIAKNHMHEKSRLYIIVNTVTDYATTIKKIVSEYSAKLLNFSSEPTKEFVADNIDWYLKLNEQGKIKIINNNGVWRADEYLFELGLK